MECSSILLLCVYYSSSSLSPAPPCFSKCWSFTVFLSLDIQLIAHLTVLVLSLFLRATWPNHRVSPKSSLNYQLSVVVFLLLLMLRSIIFINRIFTCQPSKGLLTDKYQVCHLYPVRAWFVRNTSEDANVP